MGQLKIFISYSHHDKGLAHKFYDFLSGHGFEILWDENTVAIGDDFNKKLKRALYMADIYLPIITENFENSSFTQNELLSAIGYNTAREHPRIFPYIAYGNEIPPVLSASLCVVGTNDIENDLLKVSMELNKIKGILYAEEDTNTEIAEQINTSLEIYLKDVFAKLEKNEKRNKTLSYLCYLMSGIFLLSIVIFTILGMFKANQVNLVNWKTVIPLLISNIAVISVLAALSRLAFILGKSFMVEAIRNGDRIHAISFGKFFIQAFRNKITQQEVKDVLGEWNIDKGSTFHLQDAKEIDPNLYGFLELMKSYFDKK